MIWGRLVSLLNHWEGTGVLNYKTCHHEKVLNMLTHGGI